MAPTEMLWPFPGRRFLEVVALYALFVRLKTLPRRRPGTARIAGWEIEYADAGALASCVETLLIKGWNDFMTSSTMPRILDCGANIGIATLNYKRRFPNAQITSFEPDPAICRLLRRNLLANHAEDVEVVEAAVWTADGEASFYSEGADGSRIVESDSRRANTIVKTVDFGKYLDVPVDLLKIDIEGAETQVLAHIRGRLTLVRNIIVECHIDNQKIGQFATILNVLSEAGFKVSFNSYGGWIDLVRRPTRHPHEFDQYAVVAGWRV